MTDPAHCALCGWPEPRDLGTSLAHWRDAPMGMAYEHIVACVNRGACRARVQAQGKPWPLVELAADHRTKEGVLP